jgi:hypothetical protein
MMDGSDMRVPVVAGDAVLAGPRDAVQPWSGCGATAHPAGCTCCRTRSPFAAALSALYLARAREKTAFFTRVIVPCAAADDAALAAALAADPVTAARFRFAGRLQATSDSSPSPSASCI